MGYTISLVSYTFYLILTGNDRATGDPTHTHTHTALKVQHATATFQIHTQNKYRAECVARKSDLLSNEAAVSFSASSRSGNTGLYPTTTEALERDEPGLAGWHSDFRSYTIIECFQQYCFHFAPSKIDYVFR